MPEEVTLRADLGIIEVRSYEDISVADLEATVREVRRLHQEHGVASVLVDVRRQTSVPGTMDAFKFAKGLPSGIKFALLEAEQQTTVDDVRFFETVARNRGFLVKVFPSREEALRWLGVGS